MSAWSIADAKARFSELVLKVSERPQRVTKRGRDVAVVIAPEEYERLQSAADQHRNHPMRAFLEAAASLRGGEDLDLMLPPRGSRKRRPDPFGGTR